MKFILKSICTLLSLLMLGVSCENKADNSMYDMYFSFGKNPTEYEKGAESFRLLSYNVRHCEGYDKVINYNRIAGIISGLSPDVVCLQELDNNTSRSGGVNQIEELAKITGMHAYFGKAISYQGGEYGNGILTKEAPIRTINQPLPGKEARTALVAEFNGFVLISTHLALEANNREASIKILTELARSYNKTVYLAGDFNEDDMNSTFFKDLQKDWLISSPINKSTFPANGPNKTIDFIISLKGDGFESESINSDVVHSMNAYNIGIASDHCPLFADFKKIVIKEEYPKDPSHLRLVTYYGTYCKGTDGVIDYDRFATTLNQMNADIICLQTLDKETTRVEGADQLAILANKTGMTPYFSPSIDYQNGKFGHGILSKHTPVNEYRYVFESTKENRSAMILEFNNFVVMSTQFSPTVSERISALDKMTEEAKKFNKTVYLLGYYNDDKLEGDFFKKLFEDWTLVSSNENNYPTTEPTRRLSYVACLTSTLSNPKKAGTFSSFRNVDLKQVSQHFPIYVDIENRGMAVQYPKASTDFRIGNYYVKYCMGTDGIIDYERLGAIIQKMRVDILCIQSIDKETTRVNNVDQLAKLGELTNLTPYFSKAIDYKGGEYGVGILAKDKPLKEHRYSLGGKENRAAMVLEYDKFVVISTQFSPTMEERLSALEILTENAKTFKKPVYLSGFYNDTDKTSIFFTELAKNWTIVSKEANNNPSSAPTKQTDFISCLTSQLVQPTYTDVITSLTGADLLGASATLPIFSDFKK